MPFGDHFYRSSDGELTLYARDYASSGPAVLLMHGLTRNSADFEGLASALGATHRLGLPWGSRTGGRGIASSDCMDASLREAQTAASPRRWDNALGRKHRFTRCGEANSG